MNTPTKRLGATVLAAALLFGASACSSDEKAKDAPVENEGTGDTQPAAAGDDQSGGMDFEAAGEVIGPEGVAGALVSAMGAERYEMQGSALHLYLSPDGMIKEALSACIVAESIVSEDDVVVIHDEAGETTC
ncbi:MAG: hypothetical protein ABI239_03915 [Aquihabitans sp.]